MIPQRLGQLEAFESAPPKRLVPRGSTDWWGVDPSTQRVAIAWVSRQGHRGVELASFSTATSVVERLPLIRRETAALAAELVTRRNHLPGIVAFEKPAGFGARPNPELAYGAAAIMCGLLEATGPAKLVLVEGSKWKRVICGRGDIRKPKPNGGPYAVLTWARATGYDGSSWDAADAWGIAEWARRTYVLEER